MFEALSLSSGDEVSVYSGSSDAGDFIMAFNETQKAVPVLHSTQYMYVTFRSTSSNAAAGFRAKFISAIG